MLELLSHAKLQLFFGINIIVTRLKLSIYHNADYSDMQE